MKSIIIVALSLGLNTVYANDGGVAAIQVSEIKMREYDKRGNEVRRLTEPHFKIFFSGNEAKKLQKILPSQSSVVTTMNPAIASKYAETFKTLGIYSEASAVTSKVLMISCSDGEMVTNAAGKPDVKKSAETTCEISIDASSDPSDMFGDKQDYNPSCTP